MTKKEDCGDDDFVVSTMFVGSSVECCGASPYGRTGRRCIGPDFLTSRQICLLSASSGIRSGFMTDDGCTDKNVTNTSNMQNNPKELQRYSGGFSDPAWLWKQRGLNYYWETIKMFPSSQFGRRAAGDGPPTGQCCAAYTAVQQ